MITTRSIDDEIGRLIQVDSVLFVMSIFSIVLILTLTLIKTSKQGWQEPNYCVNSRVVVGSSAFVIIMFSIMFSFGMMGHMGIPLNSICTLICFVVAGVGVDDMIVIEEFFSKAVNSGVPIGERMDFALRHGGLSVFLTSSSSVLAFLSGIGLDIPGIAQFCWCGALCFFWIWFQSVTFFPAVLCLDQIRMESEKPQCLCCPVVCSSKELVPNYPEKEPTFAKDVPSTMVKEKLTPFLTNPIAKILIPLVFAGFAGINGYALTLNGTGLSVSDVVPDDSYIVELTETTDEFWTGKIIRGLQIVFKGDHYKDINKIQAMNDYFTWLEGREVRGQVSPVI